MKIIQIHMCFMKTSRSSGNSAGGRVLRGYQLHASIHEQRAMNTGGEIGVRGTVSRGRHQGDVIEDALAANVAHVLALVPRSAGACTADDVVARHELSRALWAEARRTSAPSGLRCLTSLRRRGQRSR